MHDMHTNSKLDVNKTMAASASKTILLNKLYKRYKSYFKSIVDAEPDKVVNLLQTYLSEAQKALLSTPDKNAKAVTLKKILREKLPESEENFLGILGALNQFFDTSNIIHYVKKELHSLQRSTEQDKGKRAAKKRPQTRIPISRTRSDPGSGSSVSSKAGVFQYGKRIISKTQPTRLLNTIPGSPSNRRISDESPAEPELDSYSYQQPVEASIPEHTIIPQPSQHLEVVATSIPSCPTSRRLLVEGQWRTPIEDVYDDINVIDELDEALGKIMIVEENHADIDTHFSVVKNSYKRLAKLYQHKIEQLKKNMQRLEQKARDEEELRLKQEAIRDEEELRLKQEAIRDEEELRLKANKDFVESDVAKQLKDKEAEIEGLKAEQDSLKAKLEKATYELDKLRVESKQTVVKETYDQLRECESLLGTQKPIADILVIIRQKLSMLRKRPYST